MSEQSPKVMKLPVWRLTKAAYLVIFHNPLLALKLAIIPLVIMWTPSIILGFLSQGMTVVEYTQNLSQNIEMLFLINGVVLLSYLATIPMITAWHRMVILGHTDPNARIKYTVGKTEWTYLWKAILFGLLMFLIYLLASMLFLIPGIIASIMASLATGGDSGASIATVFIMSAIVATLLVVAAFFLRFSLVFPAAAVGQPIGFKESWRKSRSNTWRLFAAVCLGFLPSYFLTIIVSGLVFGFWIFGTSNPVMPGITTQVMMTIVNVPFWLLGLCVGVSVWSWAYRYLVQGLPITLPGE